MLWGMDMLSAILAIGFAASGTEAALFTSLEEALRTPEAVERLSLSSRSLREVPEEIVRLTNLRELDLSGNPLHRFP